MNASPTILVSPLRFIGDGILTVPLLRALRRGYPEGHIELLSPPHLVNLFERCPYVDQIHVEPRSKIELLRLVHTQQYDIALMLRRSVSEALILRLAGVKKIVGFDEQRFPPPLMYRRWGWFLDHAVAFPPVDTDIPQVKTYLSLLEPLRMYTPDEHLELWASDEDKAVVKTLLSTQGIAETRPLCVFHGTSASREKAMAPDVFAPALQEIHHRGYAVVVMGPDAERAFYDDCAMLAQTPIVNLCGKTTLRQSYVLMQKTQVLLSLDSAPIHMAAAAQVPDIIGIYGPTNEKQWRPFPYSGRFTAIVNSNLSCRPCAPKVCSHNRCRTELSADIIAGAVKRHLDSITKTAFSSP